MPAFGAFPQAQEGYAIFRRVRQGLFRFFKKQLFIAPASLHKTKPAARYYPDARNDRKCRRRRSRLCGRRRGKHGIFRKAPAPATLYICTRSGLPPQERHPGRPAGSSPAMCQTPSTASCLRPAILLHVRGRRRAGGQRTGAEHDAPSHQHAEHIVST